MAGRFLRECGHWSFYASPLDTGFDKQIDGSAVAYIVFLEQLVVSEGFPLEQQALGVGRRST
jgi:hypothetical protein